MESKIYTVYVENISDNGDLNVVLQDGTHGTIAYGEISRLPVRTPVVYVGNELNVIKTGDDTYSSRLYEESVFTSIRDKFEAREQNVYHARFLSLASEGKVALFELYPGVNAALSVNNFAINRIDNFYNVRFPEDPMPVCITHIKEDGKIYLSTAPTFGSFIQNIERLGLKEGDRIRAVPSTCFPNGNRIMTLNPNISTIVNYAKNSCVSELLVKRIDFENNRLKCDCVATAEPGIPLVFCSDYIFEINDLYVDVAAFIESNKTKKHAGDSIKQDSVHIQTNEECDPPVFETDNDKRSPFSIFEGEVLNYYKTTHASLAAALSSGQITTEHITIARAVDVLKYAKIDQVIRYLFVTAGVVVNKNKIKSVLIKLAKVGILNAFYFSNDPENKPYLVFSRGVNYLKVIEKYTSFIHTPPFPGENSVHYKNHMAQNQLMIHMLRESEATLEAYGKLAPCDGDDRPLFTTYKVVSPTRGVCYIEAARKLDEEFLLERLNRYSLRLTASETVVITLEDKEHMLRFVDTVREKQLGYKVLLTWDTNVFSDQFIEIAPQTSAEGRSLTFFKKLLRVCS